jgi:two-component system, NtrC family, nitrogen regulation response regulator GlnG
MPLEAQTRLLRVLQQGEFIPVGGNQPIKANVRIVAASHRNLQQMVGQGLFREDLFYRLNVVPLRLPALRERLDDIPALAQHFLAKANAEGLALKTLDPDAIRRLKAHDWPGNVRELENLVRRLAVLYSEDVIGEAVVDAELAETQKPTSRDKADPANENLSGAVARHVDRYFSSYNDDLPPPGVYARVLEEFERPLIARTLQATRGNQLRAADILGLNRNTLRKKIRELDIHIVRSP